MPTLLLTHPACLDHLTPPGHPERPDRLRAIEQALEDEKFQTLAREQAPLAPLEIDRALPSDGIRRGDPQRLARGRHGAARRRHLDVARQLRGGAARGRRRHAGGRRGDDRQGAPTPSSPCARPATTPRRRGRWASACSTTRRSPRATRRRSTAPSAWRSSISTCITATARRTFSGPTRRVMYCSTHEMPLYPGTGAISERGEFNTIVNAPLRAGDGGDAFREAFETAILPRLREFKPDLMVISAGFDAHTRDPLANLNLVEADYAWVTQKLMEIADAQRQRAHRLDAGRRLRSAGPGALGRRPCHRADAGIMSARRQPAIDRHIGAGDEARPRPTTDKRRARRPRPACPGGRAECRAPSSARAVCGLRAAAHGDIHHRPFEEGRAHGIAAHRRLVARAVQRHRFGEQRHAALRGIVGGEIVPADQTRHRRQIDDRAAAACAAAESAYLQPRKVPSRLTRKHAPPGGEVELSRRCRARRCRRRSPARRAGRAALDLGRGALPSRPRR